MKRLSKLDVLRGKDEDAQPSDKEEGRGLYKQIERDNDHNIEDSRSRVDTYKAEGKKSINNFEEKMEDYQKDLQWDAQREKPPKPKLGTCLRFRGEESARRSKSVRGFPASLGQSPVRYRHSNRDVLYLRPRDSNYSANAGCVTHFACI
jgi:hypothetical protein